jgi:hypothetical protein
LRFDAPPAIPGADALAGGGALSGRARARQSAVQELDDYVYRSFTVNDKTFSFLTLGEAPLKRALRLDARRKGVALGAPYSSFVDLAEEFKSMYPRLAASAESLAKVADALDVPLSAGAARGLPFCKDVAAVLVKMADDGAAFESTVGDARPAAPAPGRTAPLPPTVNQHRRGGVL